MGNIIVGGVILIAVIMGIRSVKNRAANGCCGGGGCETEKTVKVTDRDPEHYGYKAELKIEGMHCGNCKTRVENALNQLPGVWASVDLRENNAVVRMKEELSEQKLRETVGKAGYGVLSYSAA